MGVNFVLYCVLYFILTSFLIISIISNAKKFLLVFRGCHSENNLNFFCKSDLIRPRSPKKFLILLLRFRSKMRFRSLPWRPAVPKGRRKKSKELDPSSLPSYFLILKEISFFQLAGTRKGESRSSNRPKKKNFSGHVGENKINLRLFLLD